VFASPKALTHLCNVCGEGEEPTWVEPMSCVFNSLGGGFMIPCWNIKAVMILSPKLIPKSWSTQIFKLKKKHF
jgi:hypothetical protein